jgi:hypothetical protein
MSARSRVHAAIERRLKLVNSDKPTPYTHCSVAGVNNAFERSVKFMITVTSSCRSHLLASGPTSNMDWSCRPLFWHWMAVTAVQPRARSATSHAITLTSGAPAQKVSCYFGGLHALGDKDVDVQWDLPAGGLCEWPKLAPGTYRTMRCFCFLSDMSDIVLCVV